MKKLRVPLHAQFVADLPQNDDGAKKITYLPGLDYSASLSLALPDLP